MYGMEGRVSMRTDKAIEVTNRQRRFRSQKSNKGISVPAAIANIIREKILKAEYPPGVRITEANLAREFRIGQPSVREALFILEREGLVQRVPSLGTFVRQLDQKEVSDLYQIRAELEGLAGELAAQRTKAEDLQKLRRLGEGMRTAAREGGKFRFLQADLAFHRFLWRVSGNPQLAAILETVVVPLLVFAYREVHRTPEELLESAQVHLAITDALAQGPHEAREAIRNNMRVFLDRYFYHVLNTVFPQVKTATKSR
jgi:DNA-binding GntR family transcriptional regulator